MEAVANVLIEVSTLGRRREKFLLDIGRNVKESIALAVVVETDLEYLPVRRVPDPG